MRYLLLLPFFFFGISSLQAQNFLKYLDKYGYEIQDTSKNEFAFFELIQGQGSMVLIHRFNRDSAKISEKTILFDSLGNEIGRREKDFFATNKTKSSSRVDLALNEELRKDYYSNGNLKSEILTRDGEIVSEKYFNEVQEEIPKPEMIAPSPRDGMKGWNRFLSSEMRYPPDARSARAEGQVILVFTLHTDGTIHDIMILNPGTNHKSLEKEAIRVLEKYPHTWSPAKENGQAVEVSVRMPIRFRLS